MLPGRRIRLICLSHIEMVLLDKLCQFATFLVFLLVLEILVHFLLIDGIFSSTRLIVNVLNLCFADLKGSGCQDGSRLLLRIFILHAVLNYLILVAL